MRGWSRTLFTRRVSLLVTSRIGIQTQRRFAFLTCVLRLECLALIPTKCSIGLEQTSRRPGRRKLNSVVLVVHANFSNEAIPECRDQPTDGHHAPRWESSGGRELGIGGTGESTSCGCVAAAISAFVTRLGYGSTSHLKARFRIRLIRRSP